MVVTPKESINKIGTDGMLSGDLEKDYFKDIKTEINGIEAVTGFGKLFKAYLDLAKFRLTGLFLSILTIRSN